MKYYIIIKKLMFKSSRAKIPKNKSIPTNKALFVVGDIHGEANSLKII